jgi:hypothetical protein
MAANAVAFIHSLRLRHVDVLGFSRGAGREAAFLGYHYEITQVPQLHRHSTPERYGPQLTKYFSEPIHRPTVAAMKVGLSTDKRLFPKKF